MFMMSCPVVKTIFVLLLCFVLVVLYIYYIIILINVHGWMDGWMDGLNCCSLFAEIHNPIPLLNNVRPHHRYQKD